jgi:GNAT superfamily N-acetyltransferase
MVGAGTAPAAPAVPLTGVIRAGPDQAELLAAFYRQAWDPAATADSVRAALRAAAARNPVRPGEPPPAFLFLADGRPVGHLGTIPVRLWTAAGERSAHWLKGLMVLPSHRNGPVGFYLVREALAQVELALSAAVAPEARALLRAAGMAEVGAIPNAVRLLHPARVLRAVDADSAAALPRPARAAAARIRRSPLLCALAGAAVRMACGAWAGVRGGTGGVYAVVLPEWRTGELARLWARTRRGLSAAPSRDPYSLRARYGGEGGYRLLGVYEGGVLAGFAAVRPPRAEGDPRLGGARVATLSEIVAPVDRPAVLRALLRGAETVARSLDADALLCSASHPRVRAALRRRAWLPFPGNVHLLLREPPGAPPLPRGLDAWWLTRGDSHADEVF